MPLLLENYQVDGAGTFKFSAVKPEHLENTKYTLVTIVVDKSYSVSSFQNELLDALKTVVNSCKEHPMSENVLVRVVQFSSTLTEIHGLKPLSDINVDKDYQLQCDGNTALFDATFDAIGASRTYGNELYAQDYEVNSIIFIITDGDDNNSYNSDPARIKSEIDKVLREEKMESITTLLIGVNTQESYIKDYLNRFKSEANLTEYIDMGDATPKNLAKLAQWISHSISSTSQSLGTGSSPNLQSMSF